MPTYEFQCEKCGEIIEEFRKMSERNEPTKCEKCGSEAHLILSASTFHLKGTGWYVSDYKNNSAKKRDKKKEK